MKKLIVLFSLFISLSAMGATYYVAPNGSDGNNGSISQPYATLNKAWTVVSAGDIVYLRGGTYYFRSQQMLTGRSGSPGNYIKVWAYPGENPILSRNDNSYDYEYSCGVYFRGNYVHFKDIEITGYRQINQNVWSGLWVQNSNNCIFESLDIHHNGHGLFIREDSDNNLVLNSDFHHNSDPLTSPAYENADGLQIGYIPSGNSNSIEGCRMWSNSDDGIDLWRNEGNVSIKNSWAWSNGYIPGTGTEAGNGNAFKLGQQNVDHGDNVLRTISNCISYNNRQRGFDQNGARCQVVLYNNISYRNVRNGYMFTTRCVAKNNIAYRDDIDPVFASSSNLENNTFLIDGNNNSAYSVSDQDFASLDASQLSRSRNSDGSLPDIEFLHLRENSDLVDRGTNVGLPYNGNAPDLGPFEYGTYTPPPVTIPANTGIDFNEKYPNTIDLYFDQAINSQEVPSVNNFTVVFNGSTNLEVASIEITEFEVRVILENPITTSGTLSVSYSKTGSVLLQSWAGGEVESFTTQTNVNIEEPPPPPPPPPPAEELTVRIFPSPAGEYISVHILGEPITTPHFVRFYDATGELVYEDSLKTNASSIPISFPSGVYLVDIGLGNNVLYSQRIVLN